ncbi:50S ribosomal protein L11 methyltransferase [Rodentibacter pneumotropicus]|uniref:50S ribosomal protein L11 methyltransferase n=1 Tax=Rodentibacter pneumotropicus TaxID=758 RepID=A0A448MK64_9PAST|nr:50S ribosomal protein L11 methyltransferase [Rodentibacter pneumotropicus]
MSDFLEEIGAVSVTFMDSQDTPILNRYPVKPAFGVIQM